MDSQAPHRAAAEHKQHETEHNDRDNCSGNSSSLSAEHLNKLRESALTDQQITALGYTTLPNGRLLIPYLKPDGSPEECKNGKPFARQRLSSTEIQADPKAGKYRSPAGNGCRIYHSALAIAEGNYVNRLNDRFIPLRITEGEFKAEAATAHDPGRVTIALGGVSSWRDRYDDADGDSRPLVEFDEITLQGREVRLCFDSDLHKPQVLSALQGLAEILDSRGAHVLIEVLPNDLNGDRLGVDDLIYRHGAECFLRIAALARSPFKTSRQGGEEVQTWAFNPEPIESHHKAVMAWSVFKDDYAMRPGFGLYRWHQTHWGPVDGKGAEPMNAPLHHWMDLMGWDRRASTVFGSTRSEVAARLERTGWDPAHLMAFTNGTLNTETDTFRPGHDHRDQLTFAFPFAYEPEANCSRWLQFLQETIEDAEMIQLLRAALRWSVMPKDRSQPFPHEVAFDVHGRRGGGKGTLSEVLQAICGGRRGVGLIKSASFTNPNALFSLIGKRVAVDADASGRITDPGVFNSVVSNEPVEIKKLYADVSADRLGVVVWRFYNDQPGASGGGVEGMGRRVVTFRFTKAVSRPDRHLKAKLIAEAAGIFQWVWSMGADAMHQTLRDVGRIKAVRVAAVEAALEREPILRFLLEQYPDGALRVRANDLFSSWRQWAQAQGHEPGSSTRFGREVKKVEAVTADRDRNGVFYSIKAMSEFNIARHLGIDGLSESVVGCTSNTTPDIAPAPWLDIAPGQTQEPGRPSAAIDAGDNPAPEGTQHPRPTPHDHSQEEGSGDLMQSLQGLKSKLHIEDLGGVANPYNSELGLRPCTPSTEPYMGPFSWPAWGDDLLRLQAEMPGEGHHQLANLMQARHGININGKTVAMVLAASRDRQSAA